MYNRCERISDFYEGLIKSNKYTTIISNQKTGPFGGHTVSYTVLTDVGPVKVICDNGLNTLKMFYPLDILLVGSVRGSIGGNSGQIRSEGSSWMATDISKISDSGECQVDTLFTKSNVRFPLPMPK